ncbi:MAG: metal-sensitive transcriptional regulator [Micavibrio sp.]
MHDSELGKLNRIAGQIEGIKKMITEQRYCPDILTQLRAVRSAIKTVEANILETHLKSCVTESLTSGNTKDAQKKIEELKDLFKRFDSE